MTKKLGLYNELMIGKREKVLVCIKRNEITI